MRREITMKRILTISLAFLTALSVGCTRKAKDPIPNNTTSATEYVQTTDLTAEQATTDVDTADPDKTGVYAFSENFTENGCYVTLMYPYYGDGRHEQFDIAMRNLAMQMYTQSAVVQEADSVYEITDCDITLETEYFVSAVIRGRVFSPGTTRDTIVAYTVNADTQTGKLYLSEELIGDLSELKAAFADGEFQQTMGLTDVLSEITPEDIMQSWREDYGVFPRMYFTEKSFGILPEVPDVIGGYAGFQIPYTNVGDMINPVAKGLCGIIVTTD